MKKTVLPKIIVILGPTASGKSDLAVQLAKKFNGEVVSADSRQVYKGLDIGTGKITPEEMKGVPHHLLNVADPRRRYSVARYQLEASRAIRSVITKKKTPIICGGTGFYIAALTEGIILPEVPPNPLLRKKLSKYTDAELLTILKKLDARRARNIDPHNTRRIIRAIEIAKALGSVPKIKTKTLYQTLIIGTKLSTQELRGRISLRLKKRVRQGMVKEAALLHKNGLSWKRMEELGLEYRYLALHLQGKLDKDEMLKKLETEIWQYARRQMTWFKRDPSIYWINPNNIKEAADLAANFLAK